MADQRKATPPPTDKPVNQPKPQTSGRTGEGSRSVIPHLKADQKARAVARIAKRAEREC